MKLLISIVPKKHNDTVCAIIGKHGIDYQTTVSGSGTASSEILEFLSLSATDKHVILSLVDDQDVSAVLDALNATLNFSRSGVGGVIVVSVSSMAKLGYSFIKAGALPSADLIVQGQSACRLDGEESGGNMDVDKELVIYICNHGFASDAMEAARKAGAGGGTIIHGRSSVAAEKQKFLGIAIHPEKEILLIVCPADQKATLIDGISAEYGIKSEARGLCFSVKVDASLGFQFDALLIKDDQ